jgi:hypothetical protein
LARFREEERRALFRAAGLRLREDLRELFRADPREPFLALALLADLRALFLPPFRAAFLLVLLADRLAVFLREPVPPRVVPGRVGAGSSKLLNDEGVEAGVGAGVLSMGSGSIHPDPDQPISIK